MATMLTSLDVLLKGNLLIGPTVYNTRDNLYFDDGDFTLTINGDKYNLVKANVAS